MLARNDFEAFEQRLGLAAAMRLDNADDDVVAVFLQRMGLLQHFVGLADAGSGADEDAQLADMPVLAARGFKECVRRRSMFGFAPLISHHEPVVSKMSGVRSVLLA